MEYITSYSQEKLDTISHNFVDFFWKVSEFQNGYVQGKQFAQLYKLSFAEKVKCSTMSLGVFNFMIITEFYPLNTQEHKN